MTTPISLPQARIPIGYATVDGVRIPVEVDMEWMLMFTRMFDRSGGTMGDTSFNEYITQFFDSQGTDPALQNVGRAVDDLRHELSAARADSQVLRGLVESMTIELSQLRFTEDLRVRVEQIEGRLL